MGEEPQQKSYRRAGDTAKCPACGVSMDPEAYRCPKCRIYFCFKCRRRVQQGDEQFQCMNQQCEYYGKLLCNACVVEVPQLGSRTRKEVIGHRSNWVDVFDLAFHLVFSKLFLIAAGVTFLFWSMGMGWLSLVIVGAFSITSLYYFLLTALEKNPVYKNIVDENVEVGRSKCCIACRQPVEHLA